MSIEGQLDLCGTKIQKGAAGTPHQPVPTTTTPTGFRELN